jgi:hypothetical protein
LLNRIRSSECAQLRRDASGVTDVALANTNAAIATKLASASYTEADVRSKAALANTNAFITSVQSTERAALANTNAFITSVQSTERAALANTNSSIASISTTASAALPLAGGTMSGQLVVDSTGIRFSDSTTLTTAPSAGITTGKAIAMAIVFG